MIKYLLPCTRCDRKLIVDATKAGEELRCECGASLEVPSWRDLRRLETAESAGPQARRTAWNPGRGVVFGLGMVVTFGGLVTALFFGLLTLQYRATPAAPPDLSPDYQAIDTMSAESMLDTWRMLRSQGIGPYHESRPAMELRARRAVSRVMTMGLIVAAAGLLITASAWLVPNLPRGASPPRAGRKSQ